MSAINFNESLIFFTPLYTGELVDIDNEILEKEIRDIQRNNESGRFISNRNGWQSQDIYYDFLEHNGYDEFIKVLKESENIVQEISKLWGLINRDEIYLDNAWCNVSGLGSNNVPHYHANCIFSVVYYVSANENSPDLVFMRPDLQEHYTSGKCAFDNISNHYTGSTYRYKPSNGKFVVFPSWIQHYVETNMTEDERISIAINFSSK